MKLYLLPIHVCRVCVCVQVSSAYIVYPSLNDGPLK